MRRWTSVCFLAATLSLGQPAGVGAADADLTQPVTFTLGTVKFATRIPAKAVLRPSATGYAVTIHDLSKSQRLERSLTITRTARAGRFDRTERLRDGRTLQFREEEDTGGGSGGPVAELEGTMTIGDVVLFVTCSDQGEWSRDPRWCLPILEALTTVAAPQ